MMEPNMAETVGASPLFFDLQKMAMRVETQDGVPLPWLPEKFPG
jgi:hypothetical protein